MTADEVIEQIKRLPAAEQRKIAAYLVNPEWDVVHATATPKPELAKHADETAFKAALDWTFTEHKELMKRLSQ